MGSVWAAMPTHVCGWGSESYISTHFFKNVFVLIYFIFVQNSLVSESTVVLSRDDPGKKWQPN